MVELVLLPVERLLGQDKGLADFVVVWQAQGGHDYYGRLYQDQAMQSIVVVVYRSLVNTC